MKMKNRALSAVLAAVILLMVLCSPAVFAAGSGTAGGREENLVSQSQAAGEGIPEENEIEIDFFDGLEANNGLRDTLFVVGAILAFAGAAGFLCMFLWRKANKRRDRSQETREGILDEIAQAEQRNRRQRAQKQKVEPVPQSTDEADLFDTQESDFLQARPVEIAKETPIIPATPVSMQPDERIRPRVQTGSLTQPVHPVTVRPVQPREKAAEAAPRVQPETKPAEPRAQDMRDKKYDLEDILREIREGKI